VIIKTIVEEVFSVCFSKLAARQNCLSEIDLIITKVAWNIALINNGCYFVERTI
jgi:hypothetical protein